MRIVTTIDFGYEDFEVHSWKRINKQVAGEDCNFDYNASNYNAIEVVEDMKRSFEYIPF